MWMLPRSVTGFAKLIGLLPVFESCRCWFNGLLSNGIYMRVFFARESVLLLWWFGAAWSSVSRALFWPKTSNWLQITVCQIILNGALSTLDFFQLELLYLLLIYYSLFFSHHFFVSFFFVKFLKHLRIESFDVVKPNDIHFSELVSGHLRSVFLLVLPLTSSFLLASILLFLLTRAVTCNITGSVGTGSVFGILVVVNWLERAIWGR